ncbi:MAG: hypothetical protein K6F34_09950 [Lachnospiraceae bacterium]|nr:hypothetical protein [Lachnospiraceae bacterium]
MIGEYDLKTGLAGPYGASVSGDGIQFCIPYDEDREVILKIYDKSGKERSVINMNCHRVAGSVHSVLVKGPDADDISYSYLVNGSPFRDPFAKKIITSSKWGDFKKRGRDERCLVYNGGYDWKGDAPLKLKYPDVIGYMLHVRGFTKHSSSGVEGRGTFYGVISKIPYLKELGITQIEIMPAYDFNECEEIKSYKSSMTDGAGMITGTAHRINYWGFTEGSYFMPKPQYTYGNDPVTEFKDMVRLLHASGIELVMQFYFPQGVNRNLITECLRFWVKEYHVDGFHIYGNGIPFDVIATDPVLSDTKLYYERYIAEGIFSANVPCTNRFLAEYNQDYPVDIRRFLKSDEDMLHKFLFRQRCNPEKIKVINHITSYDGFTLNDLVSYDYKHNEANGEDNRDGNSYNYSWNCGAEGNTRKNAVLSLRLKQMKNAFCLLLLSQGSPMFMAGDEFMNSQGGNNNPYCQDNEVTWLNWKSNKRSDELLAFVKALIKLRREHPILRMDKEATLIDGKSCGYPDISYHAEQAWYPQMDTHIRHIGIMLCGYYAGLKDDDFFYIAANMHWEDHDFALPKLQKGMEWKYCLDSATGNNDDYKIYTDEGGNRRIHVLPRTVLILTGIKSAVKKEKRNGRRKS